MTRSYILPACARPAIGLPSRQESPIPRLISSHIEGYNGRIVHSASTEEVGMLSDGSR